MFYCYWSKSGSLHCHELERIAQRDAKNGSNIVEYDGECKGGYPRYGKYNIYAYDDGRLGLQADGQYYQLDSFDAKTQADVNAIIKKIGL